MDQNAQALLIIVILDILVILFLFKYAKKWFDKLEKFISHLGFSMIFWDVCIFGRNYFLKLLDWRQKLIEKTRAQKQTFKYIAITRFHYFIGFACLIYAVVSTIVAKNAAERFLEMASSTVAGSLIEMADIFSGNTENIGSFSFILVAIGNYLAVTLFIPRYDTDKDKLTLSFFTRFGLGTIETVLFAATTLFFSDMFGGKLADRLSAIFLSIGNFLASLFGVSVEDLTVVFILIGITLFFFQTANALLLWLNDILESFAVLGFLFLFAFIVETYLSSIQINESILYIVCILLSHRVVNLLFYKSQSDKTVPRRYVARRIRNSGIYPPEYYDMPF